MDYKNLACTLYKNLDNVNNKIDIITKLFRILNQPFTKVCALRNVYIWIIYIYIYKYRF